METKVIARVNNVDIVATGHQQLVPIKPICEALGIDPKSQREKIQSHILLSRSGGLYTLVAADGKEREMYCLPLGYIFGWLTTINPANVGETAKEPLIKYQEECYEVLLKHFIAKAQFLELKQTEIDKQQTVVDSAKEDFRKAKMNLTVAENRLKKS